MKHPFHENLRNLRIKNNLTQDQLAEIIDVSRQAISKWERGEGLPDLHNLSMLSKALGVSVDELIGNSKEEKKTFNEEPKDFGNRAGNYFKKLINKANHATNSKQAKEIRKKLLVYGGIGLGVGVLIILIGFISFGVGARNSVLNGNFYDKPYNPIWSMIIFVVGAIISGISVYAIYAGLAIVVGGVATKFFDQTTYCPNCNDKVDKDEKVCSNCGTHLHKKCSCGKINELSDIYCRECGKKL